MRAEDIVRIFSHMPQLSSERLLFRRMLLQDAQDMYAYASLPAVTRYLTWHEHPDLAYTKRYLAYLSTRYRAGEFYDFAVICREDGHMIGTCGFTRFDAPNDAAEIGYVLNPAYWNKGYGTEAVSLILHYGFVALGLHRIEARFMKDNRASRAVAEKCGMHFEGIHRGLMKIKGNYEDIGICAITSDEYRNL